MVAGAFRAATITAAASALLVTIGCAPYVERGSTLYQEGRYIEAAEIFARTEGRLNDSSRDVRALYGVYRGSTYLRLGDLAHARDWLAYAYQLERERPGALEPAERARLDRAWAELERLSRSRQVPPPASAVAAKPRNGIGESLPNGRRSVAPTHRSFVSR